MADGDTDHPAGRLGDSVLSLAATLLFFAYVAAREVVRDFSG